MKQTRHSGRRTWQQQPAAPHQAPHAAAPRWTKVAPSCNSFHCNNETASMQQSECTHEAVMFWLPCNVSCSQLSTEHWPPTKQQSMVNIDIVIIMWLTCVSFWLLDLHRTLKVTACTHTVTKATHKRPCNFCKLNDLNFMKPLIHFKVNAG